MPVKRYTCVLVLPSLEQHVHTYSMNQYTNHDHDHH